MSVRADRFDSKGQRQRGAADKGDLYLRVPDDGFVQNTAFVIVESLVEI